MSRRQNMLDALDIVKDDNEKLRQENESLAERDRLLTLENIKLQSELARCRELVEEAYIEGFKKARECSPTAEIFIGYIKELWKMSKIYNEINK